MTFIKKVKNFLKRKPAPSFLVALVLSIRWRCRVSLGSDINYPWNLTIGRGVSIGKCLIIASGKGVRIGSNVTIAYGCVLDALGGYIDIDDHSAIGPYVVVYGQGGIQIGKYNMIATHSTVVASSHIYSDVNTPVKLQGTKAEGIITGNDVWIGANAVIQDGVTLNDGVIVGSGSVVRSSFSAYSTVAGVPAKVISTRK